MGVGLVVAAGLGEAGVGFLGAGLGEAGVIQPRKDSLSTLFTRLWGGGGGAEKRRVPSMIANVREHTLFVAGRRWELTKAGSQSTWLARGVHLAEW